MGLPPGLSNAEKPVTTATSMAIRQAVLRKLFFIVHSDRQKWNFPPSPANRYSQYSKKMASGWPAQNFYQSLHQ
jgi:hypothetical protein